MKKLNWIILIIVLALMAIFGVIIYQSKTGTVVASGDGLEEFAKCLTDAGAKFYGATWCSHCQAQKGEFGAAFKFVDYVECAEGNGQAEVCEEAGITGYPTWIFGDGSKKMGEVPLKELGEKTGCSL